MTTRAHELSYLFTGGAEGLDRFYREHAPRVMGWVIRLGDPGMDSRTITSEVFEKALTELDLFDGRRSARAWLYQLTQGALKEHRRRARWSRLRFWERRSRIALPLGRSEQEDAVLRQRRLVQAALQRLPVGEREALVLVDLDDLSLAEVSEMTRRPISQVTRLLHRGRRTFAEVIEQDDRIRDILRGGRPDLRASRESR